MDISSYLIELLRLHDCVIVPDLGGFVTNYMPAEMDLASNSFNPPRKEIIFSGKLNRNDGLLVNHISTSEGIGYLEARLIVSEYVDEVLSKLENGERIELPLIGSLQYDRNEKLIFEADVKENLLIDAYGLDGFQFPHLKHNEIFISKKPLRDKESVRPVFNTRRIKTIAVAVPILLGLLFIPVKKNSWDIYNPFNYQISATAPITLNQSPAPAVIQQVPSLEINNGSITPDTVKPVEAFIPAKEVTSSAITVSVHGKYHLIGGCFKVKANAEKLMNRLKSAGYVSTIDQFANGNYIVTVQSYVDKDEAVLALRSLREQEPNAGYWMSVK